MKYTFLTICFLTLFTSCNSNSSDRFKNVDVADVVKETDISSISTSNCKTIRMSRDDEHVSKTSDLFDSVEYIPLSNDPNAIIGGISKLIVFDYSYFILDRWKTSSVKRFGLDGSYITSIGIRGEGPKEYLDATDFAIQDSMVLLYDAHQDKINYYDLNGNYVKTKKIKFLFDNFCAINSDFLCLQRIYENPHIPSIKDYNTLITHTSFNIIHKAIYNKDLRAYLHNPFRKSKGDNIIYYHRMNSDSIYSINDKCEIKAEYKFIFDKPSLPLSFQVQNITTKKLNKVTFGDEYATPVNFIMADNYVFLDYICQPGMHYFNFFSKKTWKNKYYCYNGFLGALLGEVLFDNAPFGVGKFLMAEGNNIIGYVQTSLIKSDIMGRELDPKFQKMLDNMSEDDNPWLVISHIKDF